MSDSIQGVVSVDTTTASETPVATPAPTTPPTDGKQDETTGIVATNPLQGTPADSQGKKLYLVA
jgi:hypothetical protein